MAIAQLLHREQRQRFLVEKDLVTIPSEVRPRVEETPPFARSGSFASMDTPGAYETKATEAFYYVTPVEKEWDAKHKSDHRRNRWFATPVRCSSWEDWHAARFVAHRARGIDECPQKVQ